MARVKSAVAGEGRGRSGLHAVRNGYKPRKRKDIISCRGRTHHPDKDWIIKNENKSYNKENQWWLRITKIGIFSQFFFKSIGLQNLLKYVTKRKPKW
jgi:hypothetical protein